MTFTPKTLMRLSLLTYVLFLSYSCNKDSDLLAEYVIEENPISDDPTEVVIDLENALIATNEDVAVSFNLLNNSSSTRKGRRRYKSNTEPKHGKFTIEKDSIAVYTPTGDFNGEDEVEITLEVINEDDTITEEVVDLELTVAPVEDVVQDTITITEVEPVIIEPLENDTFNEESEVIITEVSQPANGTAEINEDNTITYTPNTTTSEETSTEEDPSTEEDSFTYTTSVTNPDNTVSEETGSVTVTVTDKAPTEEPVEMGGLKAFPGAEGFGKNTTGGRGGKVLFVTNLNDSGSGSLRAALEASGTRTVIFRVGGTINLSSRLTIYNPNLTIAGQTAPGGGILIKGAQVQVSASNVIIRHIRFRPGSNVGSDHDALRIASTSSAEVKNIIVDHCSMSWATDENIGIGAVNKSGVVSNITIQNSILAETGYGSLVTHRTYDVTFYNNFFAHNSDRNVRVGGYSDQDEPRFALRVEFVNNIAYGMRYVSNITYGQKFAAYGNIYKLSNSVSLRDGAVFKLTTSGEHAGYRQHTDVYLDDNILEGSGNLEASNISQYKTSSPFNSSGISAVRANELESILFDNVGAFPLDAVDTRLIAGYFTGAGAGSQNYPVIAGGTAYTDADNDGIDDSFEIANWVNLETDNNSDSNGDGYTNLEEYLHYLTL